MKNAGQTRRALLRAAAARWGRLSQSARAALVEICAEWSLSVVRGDVQYLQGSWYITHAGLLNIARRNRCAGIRVRLLRELSDPPAQRWAFQATVYKNRGCKGFVGYGDADPSNVSELVRGAEMRVAETRAVNRALRKAYGIGLCSVEEIGSRAPAAVSSVPSRIPPTRVATGGNGSGNGRGLPRLRDRLCQLIRQHQLDPAQVKAYALDFCGTKTLGEASREQIETFVAQLAEAASRDREALVCQLRAYGRSQEAAS